MVKNYTNRLRSAKLSRGSLFYRPLCIYVPHPENIPLELYCTIITYNYVIISRMQYFVLFAAVVKSVARVAEAPLKMRKGSQLTRFYYQEAIFSAQNPLKCTFRSNIFFEGGTISLGPGIMCSNMSAAMAIISLPRPWLYCRQKANVTWQTAHAAEFSCVTDRQSDRQPPCTSVTVVCVLHI